MNKILLLLLFIPFISCNTDEKVEYIKLPPELKTYSGQNIDSLIKQNKYTALVFYCDNCGASVGALTHWKDIVKGNPKISPLIIGKVNNEKLFAALFDIDGVPYPFTFYNTDKIREDNPTVKFWDVLLIDSSYRILNKKNPLLKKFTAFTYKNKYN